MWVRLCDCTGCTTTEIIFRIQQSRELLFVLSLPSIFGGAAVRCKESDLSH